MSSSLLLSYVRHIINSRMFKLFFYMATFMTFDCYVIGHLNQGLMIFNAIMAFALAWATEPRPAVGAMQSQSALWKKPCFAADDSARHEAARHNPSSTE